MVNWAAKATSNKMYCLLVWGVFLVFLFYSGCMTVKHLMMEIRNRSIYKYRILLDKRCPNFCLFRRHGVILALWLICFGLLCFYSLKINLNRFFFHFSIFEMLTSHFYCTVSNDYFCSELAGLDELGNTMRRNLQIHFQILRITL